MPDVAILEDLAQALGISVSELLTGNLKENENPAGNMKKILFYVCPVCGNIITAVGRGTDETISGTGCSHSTTEKKDMVCCMYFVTGTVCSK